MICGERQKIMQKAARWPCGVCGSCVQSSMLNGSETRPVEKENEVALQRAEMRIVKWMCDVKVKEHISALKVSLTNKYSY